VEDRVRILTVGARPVPEKNFEYVAKALLCHQRLAITYYVRDRNESSNREVSPQLLIHYRGNWYLVAWCHKQNALRSFAMDAMEQVGVLTKTSKTVSRLELDGFTGQGYGIFSGSNVRWAKLRFSAERARWVSREQWHPLQRSTLNEDGRLILEVPFTDMRELSMDILRHGRHIEVLEPRELQLIVRSELEQALEQY
jgi:predicted DNA-binding transcriptional regulator YafY